MEKILVIDDDMRMRRLVTRALISSGYSVQEARNGREGLAAATREPPDLVVCDITMPEMNGHRVLEKLRESQATAHVPFIFLTGWGEREDLRTGMNLGADDYLVKPVDLDELLAAVQARLRRKQQATRSGRTAPQIPTPDALATCLNVTAREAEIVSWVLQGKTNPEMSIILGIQLTTVKKHLESVFTKLGVENRTALVTLALQKLGE